MRPCSHLLLTLILSLVLSQSATGADAPSDVESSVLESSLEPANVPLHEPLDIDAEVERIIRENPDLLFEVISENLEGFVSALHDAVTELHRENEQAQVHIEFMRDVASKLANSVSPTIDETRTFWGLSTAQVTIVEYADFQCPYCTQSLPMLRTLLEKYDGKVRILFKHLPLDFHPHAADAAIYYETIALQDHESARLFHDYLYENQEDIQEKGVSVLRNYAEQAGADMKGLDEHLADQSTLLRIQSDIAEATEFGFYGTPSFIINGIPLKGTQSEERFVEVIELFIKD